LPSCRTDFSHRAPQVFQSNRIQLYFSNKVSFLVSPVLYRTSSVMPPPSLSSCQHPQPRWYRKKLHKLHWPHISGCPPCGGGGSISMRSCCDNLSSGDLAPAWSFL
jgi:hypothetical protein